MNRINILIFSLACLTATVCSQVHVSAQDVLSQKQIGEYACGPCAILNSIQFSSTNLGVDLESLEGSTNIERAKAMMVEFGSRPSISYSEKTRYSENSKGFSPVDLLASFRELLEESGSQQDLVGNYLDRQNDEPLVDHLHRVHQQFKSSIDKHVPAILSLRSFSARLNDEQSRFQWEGLTGHFVTVVQVQEELRENEKGFSFEYLDSFTGKKEFGYMHLSEARNFTAAKGDNEKWEWLSDRPFLVITAPSLRLSTQKQGFQQRTLIIANYAITCAIKPPKK